MAAQHIESRALDARRERSRQALLDAATRLDAPRLTPFALSVEADLSRATFLSHFADVPDIAAFIVLRTCDLADLDAGDFVHAAAVVPSPLLPYRRLFSTVMHDGGRDVASRLQHRLRARRQLSRARVEGALRLMRRIAAAEGLTTA